METNDTPRTKAAQAYCGAKIATEKGEPYLAWYGYMSEHSALLEREIAELNQRLIERQESFLVQAVRNDTTWREKESKALGVASHAYAAAKKWMEQVADKDAQILVLREALEASSQFQYSICGAAMAIAHGEPEQNVWTCIDEMGPLMDQTKKALTSQHQ